MLSIQTIGAFILSCVPAFSALNLGMFELGIISNTAVWCKMMPLSWDMGWFSMGIRMTQLYSQTVNETSILL